MVQQINEKMTPEQFIYWLQGFFELSDAVSLTEKQVKIIKEHLEYVFTKGHLTQQITVQGSTTGLDDKQRADALARAIKDLEKSKDTRGLADAQGGAKIWTGIGGSSTGAVVC